MSSIYIRPSTPSPDRRDCAHCGTDIDPLVPDNDNTFTTSRHVIQQYSNDSGDMTAMFTVEITDIGEVMLKTFDQDGRMVLTNISYDTAYKLQTALSDAMDDLEAQMDVNV